MNEPATEAGRPLQGAAHAGVTVKGVNPPPATENVLTLAALGEPAFALAVHGTPAPQGSKTAYRLANGRTVLKESSNAVKPWRALVATAAVDAVPDTWVPLDGPLVMDLVVSLPRPRSLPKTLRRMPSPIPDLSKLLRSTEDALGTDTHRLGRAVIVDDARIVAFRRLEKVYAGDTFDPDALAEPGAVIRIWNYPTPLLNKLGG